MSRTTLSYAFMTHGAGDDEGLGAAWVDTVDSGVGGVGHKSDGGTRRTGRIVEVPTRVRDLNESICRTRRD